MKGDLSRASVRTSSRQVPGPSERPSSATHFGVRLQRTGCMFGPCQQQNQDSLVSRHAAGEESVACYRNVSERQMRMVDAASSKFSSGVDAVSRLCVTVTQSQLWVAKWHEDGNSGPYQWTRPRVIRPGAANVSSDRLSDRAGIDTVCPWANPISSPVSCNAALTYSPVFQTDIPC
jgi:hypothetical protein